MTYTDEQLRQINANALKKNPLARWRPSSIASETGKVVADMRARVRSDVPPEPPGEPAWKERWRKLRPEAMVGTRVDKLPAAAQRNLPAIKEWHGMPPGLCLWGPSCAGKTRSAWIRLFEACQRGAQIAAYEGGAFSRVLGRNFRQDRGEVFVENMMRVPVLLLDDLDKIRATPAVVNVVYSLVDSRCNEHRPTIITMNTDCRGVESVLGGTHGSALRARLEDPERFLLIQYERAKQ